MRGLVSAVPCACALVLATPGSSTAVWSVPQPLAQDQGTVTATALSMADDGTAMAAWTGAGGLGVARWDGREWSPSTLLDAGAISPSISMCDDGHCALVAYEVGRQPVVRRWDGSTWSAPSILGPASAHFTAPTALIDADGSDAMVIWQHKAGTDFTVRVGRLTAGGWSGPTDVLPTGMQMPSPSAAMSDNGKAVLTAVVPDSPGSRVASLWWNGSAWDAPTGLISVPTLGILPTPSAVISDDASTAAAIWSVNLVSGNRVQAAMRTSSGWAAPEDLSAPGTDFGWPRMALSSDGTIATAIWGPSGTPTTSNVQGTIRTAGAWLSTQTLSTSATSFPQVAVSGDGQRAIAAWNRTGGTVESASWTDGTWGASTSVSDAGLTSNSAKVAIGPSVHDAIVMWRTSTGAVQAVTPARVPEPPIAVGAVPGDASATVTWSPPVRDGGRPVTGYVATASPGGASCTSAGLSCTLMSLTNGVSYTVTVRASNVVGLSGPSVGSEVTPAATPAPTPAPGTGDGTPGATVTAQATTISGWPRRVRTPHAKVRVRFTVVPGWGRKVALQRKTTAWRTVTNLTLPATERARLSVRLGPGRYRVAVPAVVGATAATSGVLRVVRRHR